MAKTKGSTKGAHTPGPWTIGAPALRHMEAMILARQTHPEMRSTDSLSIAHVDSVDGFGTNGIGESAANARLIAAAPDLLAALREVVTWAHNPDPDGGAGAAMWERARAAIRKATEAR